MKRDLEQAAASFAAWRSTRSKWGRPPLPLVEQAVSLVGKHTKQEIARRLGINLKMLERWISHGKPKAPAFIEITSHVSSVKPALPVVIGVELADGARLKLSGASTDIAALLLDLRQGGGL